MHSLSSKSTGSWIPIRLVIVAVLGALAALTTPVHAQRSGGGTGGSGSTTDYLSTLNRVIFPLPATTTATTRTWANRALAAAGSPEKLALIERVELSCVLTGQFGSMILDIQSRSSGGVVLTQTMEATSKDDEQRSTTFQVSAGSDRATVSDGGDPIALELPDSMLAFIRRAADIWSPTLTVLGHFESVESVSTQVVGMQTCSVLTMGKPRLEGLTDGKLYLNALTGLPVMWESTIVRDIPISGKYTILTWQTVSGIMVPLTVAVETPEGTALLIFNRVAFFRGNGTAV